MLRFLLSGALFALCLLVEFAGISHLPGVLAWVPLTVVVGVYFLLHLRFLEGYMWLLLYGLVTDLLSPPWMGTVLAAAFAVWVVSLLVQQYVTHRSLYALLALTGLYIILMEGGRFLLAGAAGALLPPDVLLRGLFVIPGLGMVWMCCVIWFARRGQRLFEYVVRIPL